MADELEVEFNFPAQRLRLIDDRIQQILAKCTSESKEDVLEELVGDFENEFLLDEREKCFTVAKDRFETVLLNEGTLSKGEHLDIILNKRGIKSASKTIAKEIIELFEFIVGYTKIFPKAVVSRQSKMIELTGERDIPNTKCNSVSDRTKITELYNIVKELQDSMSSVLKENRCMGEKINRLEQEVVHLKGLVKILSTPSKTTISNPGVIPTPQKDNAKPISVIGAGGINPVPKQDGYSKASSKTCGYVSQSRTLTNIMSDNGADWTTVLHNGKSLSNEVRCNVMAGKQPSVTQHQSEQERWPPLPQARHPEHLAHQQSPPKRIPAPKAPQSPNVQPLIKPSGHKLRGVKQEKGVALYLKNINIDGDSDQEVGQMVKDHAMVNHIRIMWFRVIKYRACNDVVGCKIFVPESQEHLALDPSTWPSEISCRRWESQENWRRKNWNYQYSSNQQDDVNIHSDTMDYYSENPYLRGDDYLGSGRNERWD